MAVHLTPEQRAQFAEDGFVIPSYRLPPQDFADLKSHVDRIVSANAGKPDRIRQPFLPRRTGFVEGVDGGEKTFRYAVHPDVLDLVEATLGPDIVLIGSFMFAKPAGTGKAVPWHQDGFYLRVNVRPVESVTVWIAIDEVTVRNGCVRFVKGSSKHGILPHLKESQFGDEIAPGHIDMSEIVDAILKPGQMSIHDPFVAHGSQPNTNGLRRVGFGMNYIPAYCHYDRSSNSIGETKAEGAAQTANRPIWLVRGENRNPLNDFKAGHEGLEELDRLAEAERLRAKKAASSAA